MNAVVTLLDEANESYVRQVTRHMVTNHALTQVPTYPHLSLHVAETYALDDVATALGDLVKNIKPIPILLAGFGVFSGEETSVLYASVVRSPQLTALNVSIRTVLAGHFEHNHELYEPDRWIPHITFGAVPTERLPEAVAWLARHEWYWEFSADNLAIMQDTGETHIKHTHLFIGDNVVETPN